MAALTDAQHKYWRNRLFLAFAAWKAILLLLAAFVPGPGYDSSALILVTSSQSRHVDFQSFPVKDRLALSLFRWDALYFVKSAERDYIYEQEWAFSWAFARLLRFASRYLSQGELGSASEAVRLRSLILTGFWISTLCHFLSVLVLFNFANIILRNHRAGRTAFIACVLHILSPAGLFLSAPYAESLFSLTNFLGMFLYARARSTERETQRWSIAQDALSLSSGLMFGFASSIRSNGLLSGIIFLFDVAELAPRIVTLRLHRRETRRIIVTCIAGVLTAVGFISPQFLAYKEYCGLGPSGSGWRPWCERRIPSIYSWVQSQYWNVGFLRYWNLSNLPLFLIAVPILWLLFKTSVTVLRSIPAHHTLSDVSVPPSRGRAKVQASTLGYLELPHLALPQLILGVLATTNFHVQIINRISSGYPIWYIVIASWIVESAGSQKKGNFPVPLQWVVRGMAMYALIQGMLFANFLPPA
ncbi:glycosyltransferase family 76 protein [Amniculicola lignicola CBS 123094]|uniref:GPI mannosyltransferase 2 n=1 Tax=Amniculicola lignicola CBS 123094 TaxID=1392246 RepID=A0A6A5WGJ4_9PLEO|nr:glycosyltransferase family 76 protein [Amniculicola lignicola CBS 123094]